MEPHKINKKNNLKTLQKKTTTKIIKKMLIINCKTIEIDLINNEVNSTPYPYNGDSTRIMFSFIYYKYGWYSGFKSSLANLLSNLLCLPLDLIKFVVTLPFCLICNIVQCIWYSPSIISFLGFQSLKRIDNWLSPNAPLPPVAAAAAAT